MKLSHLEEAGVVGWRLKLRRLWCWVTCGLGCSDDTFLVDAPKKCCGALYHMHCAHCGRYMMEWGHR